MRTRVEPCGLLMMTIDADGRTEWVDCSADATYVQRASIPAYHHAEYWEARYRERAEGSDLKTFEWYAGWKDLSSVLVGTIESSARILHIGNGNSTLPEDMWRHGFTNQVCNDIAPSVVAHMAQRSIAMGAGIEWKVDDALALRHERDGEFDVVIDKGTSDALGTSGQEACRLLVAEAYRVLCPGGRFVLISSVKSDSMLRPPYAQVGDWEVGITTVRYLRGLRTCYVHVATKLCY